MKKTRKIYKYYFMNKISFVIILLIIFCRCSDNNSGEFKTNESPSVDSEQVKNNHNISHTNIPDFLKLGKNETTGYKGYLQGVDKSDSSGPYIFKEYYSDTLSFQLIYLPKHQEKSIITFDSIKRAEDKNYQDYILVAFVYPMQDPDKMEDYHEDNVTYPVNIKCYVRKEKNWNFLSEAKVKDLTEFSRYQIKCIYSTME